MAPIPTFPQFRPLMVTDRAVIEAFCGRFPPYSDFGFTSLYAWNTDQRCSLAMLGDNLVLRLKDYEADQHFLTFLGQDRVAETVRTLLAYARREGLPAELRLVPETVVEADPHLSTCFSVTADPDNFDYVYDAGDWAHFATAGFREHRRLVARCREQTDLEFRRFDPSDPHSQAAIFELFQRWVAQKPVPARGDPAQERTALCRLTALGGDNTLAAGGFFDGERLVGFSLWEGLPGRDFAVIHFQKTDRDYRGLSSWQPHAMGRLLLESGYRFINGEQDLGIRGLRIHKRSFQPCQFLRKYVIAENPHPQPLSHCDGRGEPAARSHIRGGTNQSASV